ncbi:hypothetical protein ACFQ4K_02680 [Tistrella bauzanensis]
MPVTTAAGPLDGALGLQLTHQKLTTTGEADELLAPAETLAVAGYVFEELALGGVCGFRRRGGWSGPA